MWVPSAGYLDLAKPVKDEVDLPIFHATRITDAATANHAVKEGYLDMVGMTRAFIAIRTMFERFRKAGRRRFGPALARVTAWIG